MVRLQDKLFNPKLTKALLFENWLDVKRTKLIYAFRFTNHESSEGRTNSNDTPCLWIAVEQLPIYLMVFMSQELRQHFQGVFGLLCTFFLSWNVRDITKNKHWLAKVNSTISNANKMCKQTKQRMNTQYNCLYASLFLYYGHWLINHCVTLSAQTEVHEEGDGVFKCVVRQTVGVVELFDQPANETISDHSRLLCSPAHSRKYRNTEQFFAF